jgi:hypothetical protein
VNPVRSRGACGSRSDIKAHLMLLWRHRWRFDVAAAGLRVRGCRHKARLYPIDELFVCGADAANLNVAGKT